MSDQDNKPEWKSSSDLTPDPLKSGFLGNLENRWSHIWSKWRRSWSRKKAKQAIRLFEQDGYWEDPDTEIGYNTKDKLKKAILEHMDNLQAIEVLSKFKGWL